MPHQNPNPLPGKSPAQLIGALREQIARLEAVHRPLSSDRVSSGCPPLDRLLPGGGFHRGTLVEWLSAGEGSGAETLALAAAKEASREGGVVVVLDPQHEFYPPAAVRAGIEPQRLLVVQVANPADNCWTLDQALRCVGVAALLTWADRLDGHVFRRMQLSTEEGGSLGLLLRPQEAQGEPSWADVRLGVEPLPALEQDEKVTSTLGTKYRAPFSGRGRRLRIDLLRCRGSVGGESIEVEIDDETHTVYLASPGVTPAVRRDRSRAS